MEFDKHLIHLNHTEYEEEILVDEELDQNSDAKLVVYNDDHNTFDHVIKCFVQILNHSYIQSEQLSLMIHFNGKAIVKTAPYKVLKPFKEALIDKGLSAVIER